MCSIAVNIFVLITSIHVVDVSSSEVEHLSGSGMLWDSLSSERLIKRQAAERYSNRSKRGTYLWPVYDEELRNVGIFLAAHKYYEFDRRYEPNPSKAEKPFHKHFPIPRLKVMHIDVENECRRGVTDCIDAIAEKAKISNSLYQLLNNKPAPVDRVSSYPLPDELELFQYRVTASYYMCWFTMAREPSLRFFMDSKQCLKGLEKTYEATKANRKIDDWRTDSRDKPFQCAQMLFCPDPCYGKRSGGNVPSASAMTSDEGNPCAQIKDSTCGWNSEENESFNNLVRNRFNVTCNCESQTKGYKWHSMYSMCIDRDECYERKFSCNSGTVCMNTVGAYVCVCKRDERYNPKTKVCEEFVPLPKATFRGRLKHKRRGEPTLLREFEILIGLSSGCNRVDLIAPFTTTVSFIVIITNMSKY